MNDKLKKLIIIIIFSLLFLLLFKQISNYKLYGVIEYDGYAFENGNITKNLLSSGNKNDSVDVVNVSAYDTIVTRNNKLYIDELGKKSINSEYPLFINNGMAIYNLTNTSTLIDNNFVRYETYKGFTLTGGQLYNQLDSERADNNTYVFLHLSNNMFINSLIICVKTRTEDFIIPINSVINFEDSAIRYYVYDESKYVYNEINAIDNLSEIYFNNQVINYQKLLIKLNLISENSVIKDDDSKEEEEEPIISESSDKYSKPSVTASDFKSTVYTLSSDIKINDPGANITSAITFVVKKNGVLYLRKSFYSGGLISLNGLEPSENYDIIGTYKYKNEHGVEVETTFFNQSIQTMEFETLDALDVSMKNGEIFSNKLMINDLKINSSLSNDYLVGIRKMYFSISGDKYNLSSQNRIDLLSSKSVNYETRDGLKSNELYDYELVFEDNFGNVFKLNSNKGHTRTSKEIPIAKVDIVEITVTNIKFNVSFVNKDNVSMNNNKYTVYNNVNEVVRSGSVSDDESITLTNLDANQVYNFVVYSTFDIEDGKGSKENYEIGNAYFSPVPITSLGFIRLNMINDEITQTSATYKINIDTSTTDPRLINFLTEFNIKVSDTSGDLIGTYPIDINDVNKLKNKEVITKKIRDLTSNTEYLIEVESILVQGDTTYNLKTLINVKNLITKRRSAKVLIKNSFVAENLIDFDVKVEDSDGAIQSSRVLLEIRDVKDKLLYTKVLKINEDYERLTYNNLNNNETYVFSYLVEEYNEGHDNSTYVDNMVIYKENIKTQFGISGNLQLANVIEKTPGKNVFDITNQKRWLVDGGTNSLRRVNYEENSIIMTARNSNTRFMYYLPGIEKEIVRVSFKAKYTNIENNHKSKVYITNYANANFQALTNLNEEYQYYVFYVMLGNPSYVKFYMEETYNEGLVTEIEVKDLMVEHYLPVNDTFKDLNTYNFGGCKSSNITKNGFILSNDNYTATYRYGYFDVYLEPGVYHASHNFEVLSGEYTVASQVGYISIYSVTPYNWVAESALKNILFNVSTAGNYRFYYYMNVGKTNTVSSVKFSDVVLDKLDTNIEIPYEEYVPAEQYDGTLYVDLSDLRQEIITNDFYINEYIDDELIETYQYKVDSTYEIKNYEINYQLQKEKKYKYALIIKIRDREYELSSVEFKTTNEVRGINTVSEFFLMHPTGNYVILSDLDITGVSTVISLFGGTIDFQGHKIIIKRTDHAQVFNTLLSNANIKNLVIDSSINMDGSATTFRGLALNNYGTIENIKVNLLYCSDEANIETGLITSNNYGTIRNFAINLLSPLHVAYYSGTVCSYNKGTIENGYVYGKAVSANHENIIGTVRDVGGIVGVNASQGVIQNIFVLCDVDNQNPANDVISNIGNLVGYVYQNSIIKNCFAVSNGSNRTTVIDASFGYIETSQRMVFDNLFYITDNVYSGGYSSKTSKMVLYSQIFYNNTINKTNAFIVNEGKDLQYYPQLNWPTSMGPQDYIQLPKIEERDRVDYTHFEVIENTDDNILIDMYFNNPNFETIDRVTINDVATKVVSLTQNNIVTVARVKITNPIYYYSKYYVSNILIKLPFNISYTRDYAANERILYLDLYRKISSYDDWLLMKTLYRENFRLTRDLNFSNRGGLNINRFDGKFDGQGYTIKNVELYNTTLFSTLYGSVNNLLVENLRIQNTTYSYAGLIANATSGSSVDNVHIKNATIIGYNYVGGIAGYMYRSIITNSSVSNIHVRPNEMMTSGYVGSLIGYTSETRIENCYARDIDIDTTDADYVSFTGGLVGRFDGANNVTNVYVTGNINVQFTNVGGVIGFSAAVLKNAISYVNIKSTNDYVGGVIGYAVVENRYANTLVLGNLYSTLVTSNMNSTVGNRKTTTNNYIWKNHMINGYPISESSGEINITSADLRKEDVYVNRLQFSDSFDYSGISSGYLPKLKYSYNGELLPNQIDISYDYTREIVVRDIQVKNEITHGIISVTLDNPDNYPITDLEFDYLKIQSIRKNITGNGITQIEVDAIPDLYLDSYCLKNLKSSHGDIPLNVKIDLQLYHTIESEIDWQKIRSDISENYRLAVDLDLRKVTNVNHNVAINRLIGLGDGYTIRHATINVNNNNGSLIKRLDSEMRNVNFEEIKVLTEGGYSGVGLISRNNANITNVNFTNITINSKGSYTGLIAYNSGDTIMNINMNNIDVTGASYVGGFAGIMSNDRYLYYINADNINVAATSDNVGGLIGYGIDGDSNDSARKHFLVLTNANVKGRNSVGGILGYGSANDSSISGNSSVTGVDYVGGFTGRIYGHTYRSYVSDVTVNGERYTGGFFGYTWYSLYYCNVMNSFVNGTKAVSDARIGGFAGYRGGGEVVYSGVSNTKIESLGDGVGGFMGDDNYSSYRNYVYNTTVIGPNNVGGFVGKTSFGNIHNNYVNAAIIASGVNAGGLVGNVNEVERNINIYANRVFNTRVEGSDYVGGLFGFETSDYDGTKVFSNIVVADVLTTTENAIVNASITIGNSPLSGRDMPKLGVYQNSTVNGVKVSNLTDDSILPSTLLTTTDLKTQSTYTNRSSSTSYWKFDQLANGKYPYLTHAYNQTYIDIPTENLMRMFMSYRSMRRMLIDFDVYSSSIDMVNIDFSSIDYNTSFRYIVNNEKSDWILVDKRTYTFNYDYKTPFTIEISNGITTDTYDYMPSDLAIRASVYGDIYYYLSDNQIKGNGNHIDGEYIHLYENYALSDDGYFVNLENNSKVKSDINGLNILNNTKYLYRFNYQDAVIETYYQYSRILKGNKVTINDGQIFIKNQKMNIINKNMDNKKNTIIVDSYNNKDYQVILGDDGQLYNLAEKINVPNDFVNRNIIYMTNNINTNSSFMIVVYEDYSVYGFDYRTGKKLFNIKGTLTKEDMSLLDYLKDNLKIDKTSDMIYKEYKNSNELMDKVSLKSLESFLNKEDNNKEKTYVKSYNPITKTYDIYDVETLVDDDSLNIKTENNKIFNDINLFNYYMGHRKTKIDFNINGLYVVFAIFILIMLSLIFGNRSIYKLKRNN